MLPELVTLLVMISAVTCQINGDFWWLNKNITKLKFGTAPPPLFDDVNELDTDETAKVIFRDIDGKKDKSLLIDKETINAIHFKDETELAKPLFEFDQLNANNKVWVRPITKINIKKNNSLQDTEDKFQFVFPSDNNLIWSDSAEYSITNKKTVVTETKAESSNKVSYYTTVTPKINEVTPDDKNSLRSENICTFIKKSECISNGGILYEPWMKANLNTGIPNTQVICCILPISTTSISKIIFPDNYWDAKRYKRSSTDGENPALKQRNTLLSRKYTLDNQKIRLTTPSTRKVVQKFVNSDEYPIDPYWNIKNSNIRNPDIPAYEDPDTGSDYGSQSCGDDYTEELPKPGLIGLYSDHRQTQSTWTHNKNKDVYYETSDNIEEEEFETSFGYSTIDPRQGHRFTSKPFVPFRARPVTLTATSSRVPEHNLQSPTITYHSNPDFKVLEGFKLLNLVRNKNRFVRKTVENNKEYTDNGLKGDQNPPSLINSFDNSNKLDVSKSNLKEKLFKECGKTQGEYDDCQSGLEQGLVEIRNNPWIVLVVLTKSEHSVLCYATLVHSRVAVTIADCVKERSPGAISILAGVQNLKNDLQQSQRRMATIILDSKYTPGYLEHTLALLHWIRPLIFDARVQPACLGDPHTESSCVFVGWGGYDEEMHTDLRWQAASILAPQNCNKWLSKLKVSDALCATVESRGTVTGVGGPLLCKNTDRWSVVGVAVWRNDVVVLLPPQEWLLRNMISLDIQ